MLFDRMFGENRLFYTKSKYKIVRMYLVVGTLLLNSFRKIHNCNLITVLGVVPF